MIQLSLPVKLPYKNVIWRSSGYGVAGARTNVRIQVRTGVKGQCCPCVLFFSVISDVPKGKLFTKMKIKNSRQVNADKRLATNKKLRYFSEW